MEVEIANKLGKETLKHTYLELHTVLLQLKK